jgi:hypothetical protein
MKVVEVVLDYADFEKWVKNEAVKNPNDWRLSKDSTYTTLARHVGMAFDRYLAPKEIFTKGKNCLVVDLMETSCGRLSDQDVEFVVYTCLSNTLLYGFIKNEEVHTRLSPSQETVSSIVTRLKSETRVGPVRVVGKAL